MARQDDGTPHRVLLARVAFGLMDADGDGDLSRVEIMAAFRRDERVRKLLRPLLPSSGRLKTRSIHDAAQALQQQVEAFETLFQSMDTDGSGGVDAQVGRLDAITCPW